MWSEGAARGSTTHRFQRRHSCCVSTPGLLSFSDTSSKSEQHIHQISAIRLLSFSATTPAFQLQDFSCVSAPTLLLCFSATTPAFQHQGPCCISPPRLFSFNSPTLAALKLQASKVSPARLWRFNAMTPAFQFPRI